MKQIKSHWKLAFRIYIKGLKGQYSAELVGHTFLKAIKTTWFTFMNYWSAWIYVNSTKNTSRLTEQRTLFNLIYNLITERR